MATKNAAVQPSAVYQLKVTLGNIRPPIWRRVLVADTTTLPKLHDILQVVMGWENCHLHSFLIRGVEYGEPLIDSYLTLRDERRFRLSDLALDAKSKFRYTYDFGDDWQHDIVVEAILPPQPGQVLPVCLKGKRAAPPEDIGGPWGYQALLEAKDNPRHPEYENFRELLEIFDAEAFDMEAINRQLKLLR